MLYHNVLAKERLCQRNLLYKEQVIVLPAQLLVLREIERHDKVTWIGVRTPIGKAWEEKTLPSFHPLLNVDGDRRLLANDLRPSACPALVCRGARRATDDTLHEYRTHADGPYVLARAVAVRAALEKPVSQAAIAFAGCGYNIASDSETDFLPVVKVFKYDRHRVLNVMSARALVRTAIQFLNVYRQSGHILQNDRIRQLRGAFNKLVPISRTHILNVFERKMITGPCYSQLSKVVFLEFFF
jgi:hypothetical protein